MMEAVTLALPIALVAIFAIIVAMLVLTTIQPVEHDPEDEKLSEVFINLEARERVKKQEKQRIKDANKRTIERHLKEGRKL